MFCDPPSIPGNLTRSRSSQYTLSAFQCCTISLSIENCYSCIYIFKFIYPFTHVHTYTHTSHRRTHLCTHTYTNTHTYKHLLSVFICRRVLVIAGVHVIVCLATPRMPGLNPVLVLAGFTLEQGIPHFNTKPYFLPPPAQNITALEGQSAHLHCRVAQLGDKKVSPLVIFTIYPYFRSLLHYSIIRFLAKFVSLLFVCN